MRKKGPRYNDYFIPGCTCQTCTGYYGSQTTHDPYKDNYTYGTDGSVQNKFETDYYRGQTDSNYSSSDMSAFRKRLEEAAMEMEKQYGYDRKYEEEMRRVKDSMKSAAMAAKIESEFAQLVEEMLEGINAKEASGALTSEEAEKLVQMVVDRVETADEIAGVPKKKKPVDYSYDKKYNY